MRNEETQEEKDYRLLLKNYVKTFLSKTDAKKWPDTA